MWFNFISCCLSFAWHLCYLSNLVQKPLRIGEFQYSMGIGCFSGAVWPPFGWIEGTGRRQSHVSQMFYRENRALELYTALLWKWNVPVRILFDQRLFINSPELTLLEWTFSTTKKCRRYWVFSRRLCGWEIPNRTKCTTKTIILQHRRICVSIAIDCVLHYFTGP